MVVLIEEARTEGRTKYTSDIAFPDKISLNESGLITKAELKASTAALFRTPGPINEKA